MPAGFPASFEIDIRLDHDPRYVGSTHDDDTARKFGFRAALVPGAFLYGHVSRLAVDAWGEEWLTRGAMGMRFRRPAYDGDRLTISAGVAIASDAGLRADAQVTNAAGEQLAVGWIAKPRDAAQPPVIEGAPPPLPDPKIDAETGLKVGACIGSRNAILTSADLAISLAAFQETHDAYANGSLAHPGCPMRLAMGDVNQSFALPTPPIFASIETQHFRTVHAEQRIATSGVVVELYERNNRRYFVTDEILTADGLVAARYRRSQALA
ncbi:MaoC family dehydratase [Terrarubrum flagellatum]|uniref:MaoC family dehydratase n=1 Tax=Terrirubrum flagellatum TaxID=2895980 RepID=UPI003144FFEA